MFPLRPFQKTALEALQSPAHVICVAPTGSGKSLIFERAASVPKRKTVVITPLVALARQQFRNLKAAEIPVKLSAGGLRQQPSLRESGVWILSPESLFTSTCWQVMKIWEPDLLVVDECHCLWEWGDGFRPAFMKIPALLEITSVKRSLWLTATLPFSARLQLRELLPKTRIEIGSFELPQNLRLVVERVPLQNRMTRILCWIHQHQGSGIIFVNTRATAEKVARLFAATGKSSIHYHGGMSTEERRNVENLVAGEKVDIVVATSAFGMGMHYPHLSFVILWHPSTSLLSLVQKTGRAGRDPGKPGTALILWDYEDLQLLEWTLGDSDRKRAELMDLLDFLKDDFQCRQRKLKKYFDPTAPTSLPCLVCDFCITQINK